MNDVMRRSYRELSDSEKARLSEFKLEAHGLYLMLSQYGNSRELSLAKTKLEECVMWATKALTE